MNEKGYCIHGKYVGGCGIDWICPYCEDGIGEREWRRMIKRDAVMAKRRRHIVSITTHLINVAVNWPRFPGRKLLFTLIKKALLIYGMQPHSDSGIVIECIIKHKL